ncbi:MAG: fatty acid desaturase [Bdellovibrionales bacterium]|nr:fatty acid desaturase [Bdellovibrionales bacterium]
MKKTIKGVVKPSELTPFTKSANGLNAFMIFFLYTMVAGLIYFAHQMASIPVTIICMLIMGAVQHTIATFIHEAAHGNVFSNKKANEMLGHFFFAAPFLGYVEDYRYFHWEHHRHTGKIDKDPELKLYRSLGIKTSDFKSSEIVMIFIKSMTGIYAVKGLLFLNKFYMSNRKNGNIKRPGLFEHACVGFWLLAIPMLMWKMNMLGTYFLLWIVPMFTIFTTLLLWHGFGEHIREKETCLCENTFTHRFDLITTLFLYPINSSFHLEHHLYPQLPWHALKTFRKWADQRPEYKKLASELEVDSYFYSEKSIVGLSFPKA